MPTGVYERTPEIRRVLKETRRRYYTENPHLSEQWRRNISKALNHYYSKHHVWNKGKKTHSDATRKKISETCIRNGVGTWNRGRRHNSNDS